MTLSLYNSTKPYMEEIRTWFLSLYGFSLTNPQIISFVMKVYIPNPQKLKTAHADIDGFTVDCTASETLIRQAAVVSGLSHRAVVSLAVISVARALQHQSKRSTLLRSLVTLGANPG